MTAPKFYKATLSYDKMKERGYNDKGKIGELFDKLGARRWTIGEEIGTGGYHHYQCAVEFKSGKDWNHLKNVFAGLGDIQPAHKCDSQYEIKDGNYITSDERILSKYANIDLRTWQQQAVEDVMKQNDREITVIIDDIGGQGKTTLTKYMEVNHILKACPVLSNNAQDYISYCMATPRKGYLFDIPRADQVREKNGMWKAIERIKDGHLYEPRYHVSELWIEPPKILIFTNEPELPMEKLSADRWRVYAINDFFGEPELDRIANEMY